VFKTPILQSWSEREQSDTVKAKMLEYYGHLRLSFAIYLIKRYHTMKSCPEEEIMQGTMSGARRRGRPRMAWTDNINRWTGLPVKESIRMT